MKTKIYIKRFKDEDGNPIVRFPSIALNGDWIDLRCAKEVTLKALYLNEDNKVDMDLKAIPLGVAMQLPKGYEAIVDSRSSGPKKLRIMCANSQGIIDGPNPIGYCGDNDQWHFIAVSLGETTLKVNDRICQFRIQLSQKATVWQKLKWLFSNGIELIEVDALGNENRGGLGTSGIK